MKKFFIAVLCIFLLSGCFIFRKKEKYGCPTNGKNVGAEKIISGDKEAMKAVKKAKKFKA